MLRRNNRLGNFLKLSKYGEKGRRSFVIIPKGEDKKGWTDCREQFSKLKHFHDKQKLGRSLLESHPGKASVGPVGLNKGNMIISSDQTSLQGVKKSYAEVVQGMDHTLSLNCQSMAGKNKVGKATLDKFNGRNPLVGALSAEFEEKEKAVIMTREEQVRVVTVHDMLSEFKKDLLKCLESYLIDWTSPSDVVNRAKKWAIIGWPKLRKEKPKPPVKLTYFKKSARPTTQWSHLPAGLLQVCLSSKIMQSVSTCPLEELQSRCGLGSPAFPIVTASRSPKIMLSVGLQFHIALEDAHQSTLASDPIFTRERTSPPVVSDRCSINLSRLSKITGEGIVFSTLSVCPSDLAEASAKGPNLQIVPGELSLAVNSESLDDALCSDLLRSHNGEDEGQLVV
ncbi:hypothetical protein FH972_015261 [Carpinus fangiana]|uniref:Uncharacterized protein n=1 Tax=Carpinus fangiana TaxID=176857 RepID=A0A5N6RDB1_9ROSI|nr:hypothetical protein FH972_015261 [Carpinus fangiana]